MTNFQGERAPTAETEKTRITKLHFLIHPGFDADPNHDLRKGKTADYKMPDQTQTESAEESKARYLAQAKQMGNQEIMIAFLHTDKAGTKKDLHSQQPYLDIIKELKATLSNRLVVLSDDFDIAAWSENKGALAAKKAFEEIKKILTARGFELDPETEAQSFGEYVNACVAVGTLNLNLSRPFKKPIEMNRKLSI